MPRFIVATRYLVIVPVIGLAIAAAVFFVFGGINLIVVIGETLLSGLGIVEAAHAAESIPFEVEIIEHVHLFLVGTVLYITAVGLYQLFIRDIEFPGWLKIDSTEELETNLIGVTIVVLAVNFMGVAFTSDPQVIFQFGAGIALPIAALALFIGLRTWSTNLVKSEEYREEAFEKTHQLDALSADQTGEGEE